MYIYIHIYRYRYIDRYTVIFTITLKSLFRKCQSVYIFPHNIQNCVNSFIRLLELIQF